ncbi:hypothetical protein ACODM8_15850 [Vibrio ostreicida]|uniref:hypothetical protein n=1 Tax=Vibrio ostreicida TaxID=526588 RepID=UPI003B58D227
MQLSLIAPAEVGKLLKASENITVKPSPLNQDKYVIEAEKMADSHPYHVYMAMSNSWSLREYASAQTAINALQKMGKREGVRTVSVSIELECANAA